MTACVATECCTTAAIAVVATGVVLHSPRLIPMRFSLSVIITAPAARIFDITQDYAQRRHWDTLECEAQLVDADAPSKAVVAHCKGRAGHSMDVVYVGYRRPAAATVRMVRGPWFIKSFAGSWRFIPLGEGWARVVFSYSVKCRPAWLAWLLTPVVVAVLKAENMRRLEALKKYADTTGPRWV